MAVCVDLVRSNSLLGALFLSDNADLVNAPTSGFVLGLPRKSGRCLSYAAIAAAACFSNCRGLRYPSDECRREGL